MTMPLGFVVFITSGKKRPSEISDGPVHYVHDKVDNIPMRLVWQTLLLGDIKGLTLTFLTKHHLQGI